MAADIDSSTAKAAKHDGDHSSRPLSFFIAVGIFAGLALPIYASVGGDQYILLVGSRVMTLATVAISLAFLLGNAGIISLGHAVFLGIGMYAVAIPARHGIDNGFVHLLTAIFVTAAFAFVTGLVALRTTGIFFMMITLAFAQMVYYFFSGLRMYGADDGLPVARKSHFPGGLDLANPSTLYWASFIFLVACVFGLSWLSRSYYGRALLGGKLNDVRMRALGVDLFVYRLAAYTLAGAMTGVSGFLFANVTGIATPSFMTWQRSADFLIMVALGGLGNLLGSIGGAFVILGLEGLLPKLFSHWEIAMGVVLIGIGFLSRRQPRAWFLRMLSHSSGRR